MKPIKYILASGSPRRKDLLSIYIDNFDIVPADIDENINPALPIQQEIERIASEKAAAVNANDECAVIAADTVVVKNGAVYGKPLDEADAVRILKILRGAVHTVITSVAVSYKGELTVFSETTDVTFFEYSDDIIDWYVSTGEPLDRAGAYAIQGLGSVLVEGINGDYNNVVGLPLAKLMRTLYNKGLYIFGAIHGLH